MMDDDHKLAGEQQGWERDELDRELDAALATYVAAEPRAGLEERVLANLRAEREQVVVRVWWRWPAIAVLAAAVVTGMGLVLVQRSGKNVREISIQQPPAVGPGAPQPSPQNPPHRGRVQNPQVVGTTALRGKVRHRIDRPEDVVAAVPRLERFPCPQPLSEQEEALAKYVANYPEHAVMLARARMDELRRDEMEEEMNPFSSGARVKDTEDWNHETTDR
jgi:hypothetical protein